MKIRKFLQSHHVLILLFLHSVEEARHRDIAARMASRGTLTNVLNSLLHEHLIARKVYVKAKPIRSYYSITEKGKKVAQNLQELRNIILN